MKTALISNVCAGLRNSDAYWNDDTIDWSRTDFPQGQLDEFWSPEVIDDNIAFLGALLLLGEVPPTQEGLPAFRVRTIENAAIRMAHKWSPLFINMMG